MIKINIKGPIVSNDTARVYRWLGMDAACPNDIEEGLKNAAGEDVIIEINSFGGVCVYGYEIYTAIKKYEGKVTAHVINAMSAATLPVCAANEALISDTGIFMIHNARSSANGDYRDMKKGEECLKEFNASIINAYVKKTGKSREEIQALMDNDTYMSPQTAIEQGFIDGYIFGDPNEGVKDTTNLATQIVAADTAIIPEDKARELMQMIINAQNRGEATANMQQLLQNMGGATNQPENTEVAPVQPKTQNIGTAVSDKTNNEGGKNEMTLEEFLKQNPEAQAEIDAITANAREEGVKDERERIQSLDKIANTISDSALNEAKYVKPVDGPTLAYQAMVNGDKLAAAYLASAKNDAEQSGVGDIGTGTPDAGQEPTDESEELAAYINTKGGK